MGHIRVHFKAPCVKMEGNGAVLDCRITVCNNSVEPNIQNHNQVLTSFVSTHLLPDSSQNRLAFFTCSVLTNKCLQPLP